MTLHLLGIIMVTVKSKLSSASLKSFAQSVPLGTVILLL